MTELERALLHIKTRADAWAVKEIEKALSQEPCEDVVSRQAVKVWLEEMDNKLNPGKYNTIAEYYAVKAQMQKLIYICDIPQEKSCLNCKYNNENLYRGEHCGDCDECMLWEQEEQLLPVTQKPGKCKNCKYFEYDSVAKVDGIPLIVAHEICNKWGDGCKTSEDGYCFLYEPQESEVNNG